MMPFLRSTLYLSFLASTFYFFGCNEKSDQVHTTAQEAHSEKDKTQSVEVVHPKKRSFLAEVLITGTAQPNQNVVIYARESGYVEDIRKDIGDAISKGEVIAVLSSPELSRMYEEQSAQLDAKRRIYERLKSTYEKTPSITPLQILDEAEANFLSSKAEVGSIQDRISFLQIKAPFSGVITKRLVDHGALVQNGLTEDNPQGIVELQEIDPIRLKIPLPECDVSAIQPEQAVSIIFPELPGDTVFAKVSRISGALDPASKTMRVEVDIKNSKGTIKPGMYAKAIMKIDRQENVLSLPVTAQWIFQNEAFILVVKDDVVERIPLRKGLSNKDYMEILNPEVTEETMVIVQGKGLVSAGEKVLPILKNE
jgi:membrane fusion protein, multidrug efflux system